MLLRNMNHSQGLCNGTRLKVTRLTRTSIQAQIINGKRFENEVIIPRLKITQSNKRLSMKIVCPVVSVSFSMMINKSQGQSLSKSWFVPTTSCLHTWTVINGSFTRQKQKGFEDCYF